MPVTLIHFCSPILQLSLPSTAGAVYKQSPLCKCWELYKGIQTAELLCTTLSSRELFPQRQHRHWEEIIGQALKFFHPGLARAPQLWIAWCQQINQMDDMDGDRPSWDGKHSVPSCLNGLLEDEVAQAGKSLQSSLCWGKGKWDLLVFVAAAGGISCNTVGKGVVPWVPTGTGDISRVRWREESRSAAVESCRLGKKNPAVILRGITDCMNATRYNCSCQFWLAGCRKMKPTSTQRTMMGQCCWATYAAFARGQTWLFLQHFLIMICYLGDGNV